jgi:type II secretory pathway pseudopilin PulG
MLVVVAIIGIMAAIVVASLSEVRENARQARAAAEIRSFAAALETYVTLNGQYPPDADRNIPSGLEQYLGNDGWPDGPWPESVYDWDAWNVGGEDIYQISIRFCPQGGPLSACRFPRADWAQNFDVNSAVFYCFSGPCRSHNSEPVDFPGYCLNCACKEMETC